MIQSAENNVVVKVNTKYIRHFSKIMALSALQNGSSIDPADIVNIQGEVVSVPLGIANHGHYQGFTLDNIKAGDKCIFSYLVISTREELEGGDFRFKNMVTFEGEEYFNCDITNLFAIIRDGQIIMLNGYVMTTEYEQSKIYLPAHHKRVKGTAKTQVMHIGAPKEGQEPLDIASGDFVFFNAMLAQTYQINDKKFCIIQQDKIFGKEVALS